MLGVVVSPCALGWLLALVLALVLGAVARAAWLRERARGHVVPTFWDPQTAEWVSFPSLFSAASVTLSVIVPAYNEELRMSRMLDEALRFLQNQKLADPAFTYEVIIVDDGSRDATSRIGLQYSESLGCDLVRVLTLRRNRGKGGAVQAGMLCARGEFLLFADADGATRFSDLELLKRRLDGVTVNSLAMAVGSRNHLVPSVVRQRKWYRNLAMHGLHFLVSTLFPIKVNDTQCGFKLMTRGAAQKIVANVHLQRWAFDLEMLYLAHVFRVPVVEVAVNWTEIPGSKLSVLQASIEILRDMLRIRLMYGVRLWRAYDPMTQAGRSS